MRKDLGLSFGQDTSDHVNKIKNKKKLRTVNKVERINGKTFRGTLEAEVLEQKRINQIFDEREKMQEIKENKERNTAMDAYKVMGIGSAMMHQKLQNQKIENKEKEEEER